MVGKSCKVSHCKNSYNRTKGDPLEKISYHRFPRDESRRNEWIARVCKDKSANMSTHYVCSDHFGPDDYERNLRAELLNLPMKPKLKPDAVPMFNLNPMVYENDIKSETSVEQCTINTNETPCQDCCKLKNEIEILKKENERLQEELKCYKPNNEPVKRRRGFVVWNPESPSSVSRIVQRWKMQQGTM